MSHGQTACEPASGGRGGGATEARWHGYPHHFGQHQTHHFRQHSNSNCDRSGHTRLLAQVLQNHHPWTILTYMISCCLPFRFIRETAAACDRRFCSSSVSRTRRCDSCSKSLNVTNLEMQLIKRNSFKHVSNQTVDICGISGQPR